MRMAAIAAACLFVMQNPLTVSAEESQASQSGEKTRIQYLNVGGTELIADNCMTGKTYPGVSYNEKTGTLTFNNANIKGDPREIGSVVHILAGEDCTEIKIELIGNNTISCPDSSQLSDENAYALMEIFDSNYTLNKVSIYGGGVLNLNATENLRNALIMGSYTGPRVKFMLDDCTINVNMDMDADDWLLGIHGAGDIEMNSAVVNMTVKEGSQGEIWGIVDDAAFETDKRVTLKAQNSQLHFKGSTQATCYGILAAQNVEFRNSDVWLECTGSMGVPIGCWDDEGTVTIDHSTTFRWLQTDGMAWDVGKMNLDIQGDPYLYISEHPDGPWTQTNNRDDIYTTDENGNLSIWNSFIVSPEKMGGAVKGDIDGNGYVNLNDATLCLKHIVDQEKLTGDRLAAADLNGDGIVNMMDLTELIDLVNSN